MALQLTQVTPFTALYMTPFTPLLHRTVICDHLVTAIAYDPITATTYSTFVRTRPVE